jgi:hypothetical protein
MHWIESTLIQPARLLWHRAGQGFNRLRRAVSHRDMIGRLRRSVRCYAVFPLLSVTAVIGINTLKIKRDFLRILRPNNGRAAHSAGWPALKSMAKAGSRRGSDRSIQESHVPVRRAVCLYRHVLDRRLSN